jgi:hypothetical protein
MTSWDAHRLPHVLQNAIHANDLLTITRHLPTPQDVLNAALLLALPYSSMQTITHLLAAGAALSSSAYYAAIKREDIRVFEALVEYGWDIDSTEFGSPVVSYVSRYPYWVMG